MEESDLRSSAVSIAIRVVRIVVPVIVLGVVTSVVVGYLTDYRDAKSLDAEATVAEETSENGWSEETTESAESTTLPEAESTDDTTEDAPIVVVLIEGLNMRTAATTSSDVVKRLSLNERLTLIEESSGWYHVRDSAGDEGWVSAGSSYTRLE